MAASSDSNKFAKFHFLSKREKPSMNEKKCKFKKEKELISRVNSQKSCISFLLMGPPVIKKYLDDLLMEKYKLE